MKGTEPNKSTQLLHQVLAIYERFEQLVAIVLSIRKRDRRRSLGPPAPDGGRAPPAGPEWKKEGDRVT